MVNKFLANSSLTFILIVSFCFTIQAQDLSLFTFEETSKANTAKQTGYLTPEEKKVILLMNLARINGSKFAKSIAMPYIENNGVTPYTKSLIKQLNNLAELPALQPQKDLYEIARKHATNMGKNGKVGHDNFVNRINPVKQKYYGVFENCDYGFEDALSIVMRLLIDEGLDELGHREAILNSELFYVGVSIQPHTKWKYNCVQEFGGKLAH